MTVIKKIKRNPKQLIEPSESQTDEFFLNNEKIEVTPKYVYGRDYPPLGAVIIFIQKQIGYVHDVQQVIKYFFGKNIFEIDDVEFYTKMRLLTREARHKIADKEKGRWKLKGHRSISPGRSSQVYQFLKD